jgi:hypothetical protein
MTEAALEMESLTGEIEGPDGTSPVANVCLLPM